MAPSAKRRYDKLARAEARLARRTASHDRAEEERLRGIAHQLAEARLMALEPDLAPAGQALARGLWPRRRAVLIINSKSGPKHDSLLRTREIVSLLGAFNIETDVRVKLRKSQARQEARLAAKRRVDLVIAAGGDGTVEAVARGLVGTGTALGILPLGTYNNVAASLGIPTDLRAAIATLATYDARPIDVAQVLAKGMDKPRVFIETATVGLGAVLTPLGQHVEKGRLDQALKALPLVLSESANSMLLRLGPDEEPIWTNALLLTISNTPRAGAALMLAPAARVDDGLLDLAIYDRLTQADLVTRVLAIRDGTAADDPRIRRARVTSVEVHTAEPTAVAADSKLVGVTPARFSVRRGALLAVVGRGPGVLHPATDVVPLQTFVSAAGDAVVSAPAVARPPTSPPGALASAPLAQLGPPLLAAVAGATTMAVVRALAQRFGRMR